jgi:hypothetical protein
MTKLTDVVAREHIVDLPEEGEAERHVGVAQARSRRGGVQHPHTRPEGSLAGELSSHDMPLEEIRAVLRARDPVVVARYMELHRERLAEQLAHRIRELEALERILARRSRPARRSDELSGELHQEA